jgi:hypothetical protein
MVLYLIGLGLFDEQDITLRGLAAVKGCARVYLEAYTSILLCDKVCAVAAGVPLAHLLVDTTTLPAAVSGNHLQPYYIPVYCTLPTQPTLLPAPGRSLSTV